jgi:hypothetical protein
MKAIATIVARHVAAPWRCSLAFFSELQRIQIDSQPGAVRFHLTLPNYPEGGPKRYALVGARLMQYRGEDVAYLAYEMDRKPISLISHLGPHNGHYR